MCLTLDSKGNFYSDNFESVTPDQGLADPVASCFAQDTYGYLWIGTKGGLNRYDGYHFVCISNIKDVSKRYGSEVMICETGMPWNQDSIAKEFLTDLITRTKELDHVSGVFYWEPESYNAWNNYQLGAFDASGKPTQALDAFK